MRIRNMNWDGMIVTVSSTRCCRSWCLDTEWCLREAGWPWWEEEGTVPPVPTWRGDRSRGNVRSRGENRGTRENRGRGRSRLGFGGRKGGHGDGFDGNSPDLKCYHGHAKVIISHATYEWSFFSWLFLRIPATCIIPERSRRKRQRAAIAGRTADSWICTDRTARFVAKVFLDLSR